MESDFLRDLEYLGLSTRFKRISDKLLYGAKDLYKSEGLEIAPNWYLIFYILKERKTITMSEIAELTQLSQAAIIKIINKMKAKGYLVTTTDTNDSRKQQLHLSKKALKELPKLEKIWEAGRKTIRDLVNDDPVFLEKFKELELREQQMGFKERTLGHLDKE